MLATAATVEMPASTLATAAPHVSFVIPVYNEEDNVADLLSEVHAAGARLSEPYEVVLVDDGSRDETVERVRGLAGQYADTLRLVCLRRNYGQTAAMAAGFAHARGSIVVTLDGDLQNDPADVPALVAMMEQDDLDIISGWRKNRQDKALTRKLPSMIANNLIGKTTGVKLHDYGCSLKVYRAELIRDVPLYGEMHRFIPALASIDGAKIREVPVNHRARTRGVSKYNLSRTFKVILDLLTVVFLKRFFTRPLHMFGRLGMVSFLAGAIISTVLLYDKFIAGHDIGDRPLLILAALLFITAIQLVSTGLVAEVQVRTYFESQNKPIYKVREIITGDSGAA